MSTGVEYVRNLCKERKIGISTLEKNLGFANGYLNPKKLKKIPFERAVAISNYLHCDLENVLGVANSEISNISNKFEKANGVWIPVLGRVAAGIPINMVTDIIDQEQITEEMAASGEYFALQIHGDSMEPKMSDGDVVIVRQQDDAESGEIVIATINGDNATCKRLRKYAEGIMLLSTNPAYEPMTFTNHDIEELPVKILGKIVELRAKF